jgi:hypothetical protein
MIGAKGTDDMSKGVKIGIAVVCLALLAVVVIWQMSKSNKARNEVPAEIRQSLPTK